MKLSDRDIRNRLRSVFDRLSIEPLDDPDDQIQPASVDLRLGPHATQQYEPHAYAARTGRSALVDPTRGCDLSFPDPWPISKRGLTVAPGDFVLCSTRERITLPNNLVGIVDGRSSLGRLGISIHSTAGFIDPGFDGHITLEITNVGRWAVVLHPMMKICQISFEQLLTPCDFPYGDPHHRSKYQGQEQPTASRLDQDFPDGRVAGSPVQPEIRLDARQSQSCLPLPGPIPVSLPDESKECF